MAAHLLQRMATERGLNWEMSSAGTGTSEGYSASLDVLAVLKNHGLDATKHRTRLVSAEQMTEADWVLAMTERHAQYLKDEFPEAADKVILFSDFYRGADETQIRKGIPDPVGAGIQVNEKVYTMIENAAKNFVETFRRNKS